MKTEEGKVNEGKGVRTMKTKIQWMKALCLIGLVVIALAVFPQAQSAMAMRPLGAPPDAFDDSYEVDEGGTLTVAAPGVLGNDTEATTAGVVTGPVHGVLTLHQDGSFEYVHDGTETTSDSFVYRTPDSGSPSDTATVTITIHPINDAPSGSADAYSVRKGELLVINPADGVLDNDSDPEGSALSAVLETPPQHGSLGLNLDGSFLYLHNGDDSTSDTFAYKAFDGGAYSGSVEVTINVTEENLGAPTANADAFAVQEAGRIIVGAPGLLGNDEDPDNTSLTTSLVSGPSHGTLTLNADGSFDYTHDGSTAAVDSFAYRASDGELFSTAVTVTLQIVPVNDMPGAAADSYTVSEGATLTRDAASGVRANDSDEETPRASLTVSLVTGPAHGALTLNGDGSFTYVHDGSEASQDQFSYRVSDGAASSVGMATLTITAVNDAPIAHDDAYSANEGGTLTISAASGVRVNDTDADHAWNQLTVTKVTDPSHGSVTLNSDGSFTYIHNGDEAGLDAFTYSLKDPGNAASAQNATVRISISAVNDAPVGQNDSYGVTEGGELVVGPRGVLGNDTDAEGTSLTATQVSSPTHGTLTFNANGSFTYLHDGTETTTDSFTYQASDGDKTTAATQVTITVKPVNDVPVAVPEVYALEEGGTLNVAAPGLLENDSDTDGPSSLTAVLVTGPQHAAPSGFTLNANGSFTYVHDGGQATTDTFQYKAFDGSLNSAVVTVTLNISGENDLPYLPDLGEVTIKRRFPLEYVLPAANDPDGGEDNLVYAVVSDLPPLAYFEPSTRTLRWKPSVLYPLGSLGVTFRVTDEDGGSIERTLTVYVEAQEIFHEAFVKASAWKRYTNPGGKAILDKEEQEYRITHKKPKNTFLALAPIAPALISPYADATKTTYLPYSVEADFWLANRETNPESTSYSLLFDVKSNSKFYRFKIFPNTGEWFVDKYVNGWINLIKGQDNININPGSEKNHLKVMRDNDQITVWVNGIQLGDYVETGDAYGGRSYVRGRVGALLSAGDWDPLEHPDWVSEVVVDDFVVNVGN